MTTVPNEVATLVVGHGGSVLYLPPAEIRNKDEEICRLQTELVRVVALIDGCHDRVIDAEQRVGMIQKQNKKLLGENHDLRQQLNALRAAHGICRECGQRPVMLINGEPTDLCNDCLPF